MKIQYFFLTISLFLVNFFVLPVDVVADADAEKRAMDLEERYDSLRSIRGSIKQVESDLREKQRELRSPSGEGRSEELNAEIRALVSQLKQLETSFEEISSGVDLAIFTKKNEKVKISWTDELSELVGPILGELKDFTSRPREINKLQTKISRLQEQLPAVKKAMKNIAELEEKGKQNGLYKSLKAQEKEWEEREQRLQTELSVVKRKLAQRLSERTSLSDSLEHIFQVFFRSRGRNLVLALLATMCFWFVLRRAYRLIRRIPPLQEAHHSFAGRLFNVFYLALSGVGTASVFLLALYLFADWVLLILAVMLLIGLVWASKQALPRFWVQASLLLNVGTVREQERVVVEGIPWYVDSINFYVTLTNPELSGGLMRLPISDLAELRSRPSAEREPWFVTRKGDWITIDDVLGKVVYQSPQVVKVLHLGGAVTVYPTSDFLGLSPTVLSKGYRLETQFGVDYKHQAEITEAIPQSMKTFISSSLEEAGVTDEQVTLQVEFAEAASSSLNLAIIADFHGDLASRYPSLTRTLQKAAVDACNQFGWEIPFEQLTLHMTRESNMVDILSYPKQASNN